MPKHKPALGALLAVLAALAPGSALAHVKWFYRYDLLSPPRSFTEVLTSASFVPVLLAAVGVLFVASLFDSYLVERRLGLVRGLDAVELWFQARTYPLLRVLIAAFFVLLGLSGKAVFLTPELAASSPWVGSGQIVIGLLALFRATGPLAALGITLLYGMSIEKYGLFHMLDYPAFLGAAVYLMWMSFDSKAADKALGVLRAATALTLMIGATEKFGYPNWSFDLLRDYPALKFGLSDLEFYMVGAGTVEFALAYLVLVGRVSGKAGAAILFTLMAAAIPLFGWMDALGHALFLAALFVLAFNGNPLAEAAQVYGRLGTLRTAALNSALFAVLVLGFVGFYHLSYVDMTTCSVSSAGLHLHK